MTPVFNEYYGIWVHPGQSGFWGAVVAAELRGCNYYHHLPIERDCPVIVDVGGHYGIFAKFAAERYRSGHVYFVEPHPENFQIAEKNLDGLANVTMIQGAVTYEDNVVLHPFASGRNSGGSQVLPAGSSPFENDTSHGLPVHVSGFGLEHLVNFHGLDRIDLLKLDCEGSEYSILAKCSCLDRVAEIVGEWHRVPDVPRFDEFCRERLPAWKLETFGRLDGPLGMFRLTNPSYGIDEPSVVPAENEQTLSKSSSV